MATAKRANSTHHRKRYGQHQRQSKPFLKTYLPYLPLLTILIVGFIFAFHGPAKPFHDVLSYATSVSGQSLLDETNAQRATYDQPALKVNAELATAAQAKANDMATRNYWSHTTPDGKEPWFFMEQAGYEYQKAGENLAYGFSSSAATVAGWMNSPSHRANLLDGDFDEVGFGYANAANYQGADNTIIVAMYGRNPAAAAAAAEPVEPIVETQVVRGSEAAALGNVRTYRIARIQIVTNGKAAWSIWLLIILAVISIAYLVIKHSLSLRRMIARGERFALKHPLFDVTVASFIVLCVLISRVEGYILSATFTR